MPIILFGGVSKATKIPKKELSGGKEFCKKIHCARRQNLHLPAYQHAQHRACTSTAVQCDG